MLKFELQVCRLSNGHTNRMRMVMFIPRVLIKFNYVKLILTCSLQVKMYNMFDKTKFSRNNASDASLIILKCREVSREFFVLNKRDMLDVHEHRIQCSTFECNLRSKRKFQRYFQIIEINF